MSKNGKTKKELKAELEGFRKLSMSMLANKIHLDYRVTISVLGPMEPEGYVEDYLRINFPNLTPKMRNMVWCYFLNTLVSTRKGTKNGNKNP